MGESSMSIRTKFRSRPASATSRSMFRYAISSSSTTPRWVGFTEMLVWSFSASIRRSTSS
jgi:hypothetical protein